jgi:hypothetical protein
VCSSGATDNVKALIEAENFLIIQIQDIRGFFSDMKVQKHYLRLKFMSSGL